MIYLLYAQLRHGKERKMSANSNGLKIIIVGAGKVGETLTAQLIKEKHDI